MNILFLLLDYSKNKNHMGLYKELVYEFRDQGHEVYVATATEKKWGLETTLNKEDGINVLRLKTGNMFEVGFIEKGITNLTLGSIFKKEISREFSNVKFDLVIHHTPPITFTPVIDYLKKKYKTKSYLILRDIFPQNAKDLGIIKNPILFEFFRQKERKLYGKSDYIGCMSEGNINFLRKHNPEVSEDKVHILRNWGKIKNKPIIDKKIIREKYGFKELDFITIFGGNMGKPQGLEFLMKLAKEYKYKENIKFLMVGKGNEKKRLEEIVEKQKLSNVIFLNFIPREDYEKLTAACDLGIVSLHSCFTIPNIPSKTIDYCKLGLPILACTDRNTDYPEILENEAKCGLSSIYGDLKTYKINFEELLNNKELRESLGENGREYYEEKLGVDIAYETIMNEIKKY
ncbi:glycosyltransferase family 4 protein [Cetobacterium sp. 2A]|uniref:glycosyltransferase family 4 protein n=1 Tax=Cetobacterium sp. 2A TaxID=2754723 RepID=UPI00163D07C2|nr:glycosyltransferase family 4 protein [Cetobacterium sp. 2A]MBC2856178.1 glycosyltransferase family 4 protein [Cetobacterium sp. 2A]